VTPYTIDLFPTIFPTAVVAQPHPKENSQHGSLPAMLTSRTVLNTATLTPSISGAALAEGVTSASYAKIQGRLGVFEPTLGHDA
jgi:hypothetical protein